MATPRNPFDPKGKGDARRPKIDPVTETPVTSKVAKAVKKKATTKKKSSKKK